MILICIYITEKMKSIIILLLLFPIEIYPPSQFKNRYPICQTGRLCLVLVLHIYIHPWLSISLLSVTARLHQSDGIEIYSPSQYKCRYQICRTERLCLVLILHIYIHGCPGLCCLQRPGCNNLMGLKYIPKVNTNVDTRSIQIPDRSL